MARVLESDVRTFADSFAGRVFTDRDADYDSARSIWNGAIDRRPEVIARCSSPEDVAAAIRFARGQGLEVSVRGGGHAFSGTALCEGGLTVDLGGMKRVAVDPAARRATAGGGASGAEVDAATQAHGLAVPLGTISHTGIGGLTLGGGFGWLTPKLGLSIDNLDSAGLVTAGGEFVRASADENPDLFWAIRGGGGNFGVVTSFDYRLHEIGPMVQLGLFFWNVERGVEALRFARDLVASLPEDMGTMTVGMSAPPAPFVPEQHHFTPGFALVVVGWGTPEEHERAIRPVRETMAPLFELVTPIPYANLQQMLDESAPWGILAYEKALYLDDLSDPVIDIFADYLPRRTSPMSICPVFRMGGAFSRVADEDTAFGGSRRAGYAFNIAAVAPAPELLEADRAWARSFWEALSPHASGAGSYVNFMTEYDDDRVRTTYGPAKYDRLARIKARYDPDNVFHLNANIRPAA